MQANAMMYLGENYRATAAYDRGLINDIYGVHSFDEDISKRIKQVAKGQTQVYRFLTELLVLSVLCLWQPIMFLCFSLYCAVFIIFRCLTLTYSVRLYDAMYSNGKFCASFK